MKEKKSRKKMKRKNKTYMDKLMKDEEFRKEFTKEYQTLTREEFINKKLNIIRVNLEKYLPEKESELQFEDIFNNIKEVIV
jgi:uncharacterized protein YqeY